MHLSVTYALIADADYESERFRWAGGGRFAISAVARLINLRHYKIRLSFLPHTKDAAPAPVGLPFYFLSFFVSSFLPSLPSSRFM